MDQLSKLQHNFQDCVLDSSKSNDNSWVSAKGRATPEIQLSIYSYAYAARLREVLGNDYPALLMALGEDQFNQLTNDYIEAHPSHNFSLREFGHNLPDFIADLIRKNSDAQELNWQYELVVFEYSLGLAFDTADTKLFSEQDMATIAPEAWPELKFTLHPSVQRLDFEWNTTEMWQALTADEPKSITAQAETSNAWIVWREQLTTRFRSMPNEEKLAFDTLLNGGCFNDICESLAEVIDEANVPLQTATFLKDWIVHGLITEAK